MIINGVGRKVEVEIMRRCCKEYRKVWVMKEWRRYEGRKSGEDG